MSVLKTGGRAALALLGVAICVGASGAAQAASARKIDASLRACSRASGPAEAVRCLTGRYAAEFARGELIGMAEEFQPGLAARYAAVWTQKSKTTCAGEATVGAALQCADRLKAGVTIDYMQANVDAGRTEIARDPIVKLCRETFGDYWEGVENCVARQRAARGRMGF